MIKRKLSPRLRWLRIPVLYFVVPIVVLPVLFLLVVGGVMVALGLVCELTGTSVGDIEGMIETDIPLGSSSDDILAFLDSRDIEHDPIERFDGSSCCRLQDAGVLPGTLTIAARVPTCSTAPFVCTDDTIYFELIFDEQRKLQDYLVWWDAVCL